MMNWLKVTSALLFLFIIHHSTFNISARAQFWHALPPSATINAGFSNDEKQVFFVSKVNGVANIFRQTVADKYNRIIAGPNNPPVQVTHFTDRGVTRMFHLLNRPEILFTRATANGKDVHLYRIKDDGSAPEDDLTPAPEGVTCEMLGASYNGRYVYYTENKVNRDKTDVYRYDTQQFTSDLVFPNDKDYQVLAWSRDHGRLLIQDPHTGDLTLYDIESTERMPLVKPANGVYQQAIMDPMNHELIVLEKSGTEVSEKTRPISNGEWKEISKGDISWVDYSPNGKYVIVEEGKKWTVKEIASGTTLTLPEGAQPVAIAPKETMLLYMNGGKLFLFDIVKKVSYELAAIS